MRESIFILILMTLGGSTNAQQGGVINNAQTPKMKLKSIDITDCKWTDGFWADKVQVAYKEMIPNLGRLMDDPEIIHAYDNQYKNY